MNPGTTLTDTSLEQRSVNAIRALAIDAVQQANSGHPGLPMGAADLAYVLWTRFLKFDPQQPRWFNRDRFVLSGGHGCMLQYALLHLLGFDVSLDDLKDFRQWGSKTPGHPEAGHTPGVDTTTGPLGQGLSTAVGMALAETHLAARLNHSGFPVVDHRTFVLATDGDMMEGVQAEAASLAGHWKLGKLIVVYDDNRITIDGSTDLTFTEDVAQRYASYGWHVQQIDGHDREAIEKALNAAVEETGRPSLVMARTKIALGSPNKEGTSDSHGAPLGEEEVRLTKQAYDWPTEPSFHVPKEVREHFLVLGRRSVKDREQWDALLSRYRTEHPDRGALWDQLHQAPRVDPSNRPRFAVGDKVATRAASGKALAWLAQEVPFLWGGSADLAPSNKTLLPDHTPFSANTPQGRNLHFGVREHGMAAILNGLALHGMRPYGGTFLVFADYLRPALRLSALMKLPVVYVFTHDSIYLGEDGPTHQPISHLPALRAIPNLTVLRPCDAEETLDAWEVALEEKNPTALILTRQSLPVLDPAQKAEGLRRGAYVVASGGDNPGMIVFASGSEVSSCLEALNAVDPGNTRVRLVAVPSWELFERQDAAYRDRVLSPEIPVRVAVEAGSTLGWERFVGMKGTVIGMNRFGASAPAEVLADRFGFTPERLAEAFAEFL